MERITTIPRWKIYAALAFVPGLYFVLLLSIAMTVVLGGGLILCCATALDSSGSASAIVGKFLLLIGLGVLLGVVACIRGVIVSFSRTRPAYPAIPLNLEEEPKFKALITDLCAKVGTKLPESTIIHTYSEFFVQQGSADTLDGRTSGRLLCISAPMLRNLSVNELRAILAHEFAHFSGNDTAYTMAVLPIYRGALGALQHLAEYTPGPGKDWRNVLMYIPLFLPHKFLQLYLFAFHRLNMQLSRAREFRADRIASEISGKKTFVSALSKVMSIGSTFDNVSAQVSLAGFREQVPHKNLYVEFQKRVDHDFDSAVKMRLEEYMKEEEHATASHPSIATRMSAIPEDDLRISDDGRASDLLMKINEYEETLSSFINTMVYHQIKQHEETKQVSPA